MNATCNLHKTHHNPSLLPFPQHIKKKQEYQLTPRHPKKEI